MDVSDHVRREETKALALAESPLTIDHNSHKGHFFIVFLSSRPITFDALQNMSMKAVSAE